MAYRTGGRRTLLIGHSLSDADGVIVSIDQRLCDLLERSRSALVGRSYLDITYPDDKPENRAKITSLKVGEVLLMRKRYMLPDGSPLSVSMHVSRFQSSTGRTRLIGSISIPRPARDLHSPTLIWSAAHKALHILSLRKEMLGELHNDFAWEIVLHVYLAEAEGRAIHRAEVSALIGQSCRTTDRWIDLLRRQDVLDVAPHQTDLLQMSGSGLGKTERILLS